VRWDDGVEGDVDVKGAVLVGEMDVDVDVDVLSLLLSGPPPQQDPNSSSSCVSSLSAAPAPPQHDPSFVSLSVLCSLLSFSFVPLLVPQHDSSSSVFASVVVFPLHLHCGHRDFDPHKGCCKICSFSSDIGWDDSTAAAAAAANAEQPHPQLQFASEQQPPGWIGVSPDMVAGGRGSGRANRFKEQYTTKSSTG